MLLKDKINCWYEDHYKLYRKLNSSAGNYIRLGFFALSLYACGDEGSNGGIKVPDPLSEQRGNSVIKSVLDNDNNKNRFRLNSYKEYETIDLGESGSATVDFHVTRNDGNFFVVEYVSPSDSKKVEDYEKSLIDSLGIPNIYIEVTND